MRRNRTIAAAVIVASMGAASAASATSGQAAIDALIGNTLRGKRGEQDAEFFAHFAKDGWVKSTYDGRRDDAKWQAKDGKLCLRPPVGTGETCFNVEVTGDDVALTSEGTLKAKLLPGNPQNLQ